MKQETSREEGRVGAGEDGGPDVSLAERTTRFELQPLLVLHALSSDEVGPQQNHQRKAKTSPPCADEPTEQSVRTPDTLCIRP